MGSRGPMWSITGRSSKRFFLGPGKIGKIVKCIFFGWFWRLGWVGWGSGVGFGLGWVWRRVRMGSGGCWLGVWGRDLGVWGWKWGPFLSSLCNPYVVPISFSTMSLSLRGNKRDFFFSAIPAPATQHPQPSTKVRDAASRTFVLGCACWVAGAGIAEIGNF